MVDAFESVKLFTVELAKLDTSCSNFFTAQFFEKDYAHRATAQKIEMELHLMNEKHHASALTIFFVFEFDTFIVAASVSQLEASL